MRLLLVALCGCTLFCGCTKDEEKAVPATTPVASTTPAPPTGSDYHSTVMRARMRTLDVTKEASAIREEQKREEEAFSKPGIPGQATPASADVTP